MGWRMSDFAEDLAIVVNENIRLRADVEKRNQMMIEASSTIEDLTEASRVMREDVTRLLGQVQRSAAMLGCHQSVLEEELERQLTKRDAYRREIAGLRQRLHQVKHKVTQREAQAQAYREEMIKARQAKRILDVQNAVLQREVGLLNETISEQAVVLQGRRGFSAGFTLIEALIIACVIGVVGAIALPMLMRMQQAAPPPTAVLPQAAYIADNLQKVCDGPNLVYIYHPSYEGAAIAVVANGCVR